MEKNIFFFKNDLLKLQLGTHLELFSSNPIWVNFAYFNQLLFSS